MDKRIPVTLLTGFLGSGKTTLLARLLNHTDMKDPAVVINELGEAGLDQAATGTGVAVAVRYAWCTTIEIEGHRPCRESVRATCGACLASHTVCADVAGWLE